MTVKLLTVMSGPDGCFHPGEHTFDAAREKELIAAGYAEPVPANPPPRVDRSETATPRVGENAALQTGARRGRKAG